MEYGTHGENGGQPMSLEADRGSSSPLSSYDLDPLTEDLPTGSLPLIVYDRKDSVRGVERTLLSLGMIARRCRSCSEVRDALCGPALPPFVMTSTSLPDVSWEDVLTVAGTVGVNIPVIVISRVANARLYLDVLEKGAHDFIVPPISSSELAYIIRAALGKINYTRGHQ